MNLCHQTAFATLTLASVIPACGSSSAGMGPGPDTGAPLHDAGGGRHEDTGDGTTTTADGSTEAGAGRPPEAGGGADTGSDTGTSALLPKCGPALPAPTPGGSTVVLQVDPCAGRNPISEDIYGITFFWDTGTAASDKATLQATQAFAKEVGLPINRLGGDGTTRYNWQVDATNAGEDFYFNAGNGTTTPTPGAGDDALITLDNAVGSSTIITIPIIDYINKTSTTNCSYPQSEYPTQDAYNPYVMLTAASSAATGKRMANRSSTHIFPITTSRTRQTSSRAGSSIW